MKFGKSKVLTATSGYQYWGPKGIPNNKRTK